MASENDPSRLFRIRKTVMEMLNDRNYIVADTDFRMSLEEFRDAYRSSTSENSVNRDLLTLLVSHRDDPNLQVYVFFPEDAKVKSELVNLLVERMKKNEVKTAILVVQQKLTSISMRQLEKHPDLRFEVFVEDELVVNITRHEFVPTHIPLNAEKKKELLERYKLKESQLPRIRKDDPVAKYFGLQPQDVVKIIRKSETAGRYVTYRLVV
eukprot:TRINITY_DN13149_c0_g1_i1.p1 TRINITY_DN13149_c0_g1~~TRINITY_DN13149_c0_g1_i1.p1  ORF type:complete len:210 (+),score=58.65 TRINITY_DN13149_c0_g1_i1:49-678(+)